MHSGKHNQTVHLKSNNKKMKNLLVGFGIIISVANISWAATFTDIPIASVRDHDFTSDGFLYVTAGKNIHRYDLLSCTLETIHFDDKDLYGIDVSPKSTHFAVGVNGLENGLVRFSYQERYVHRHVIGRAFTPSFDQNGTFMPAFINETELLLSGSVAGSGWVPMRRFDVRSGVENQLQAIQQDSMLTYATNAQLMAVAESNISSGPVRVYDPRSAQFLATFNTGWFMFDVAVNASASTLIAPSYNGAYVLRFDRKNASLEEIGRLGQYASHGPRAAVFLPDGSKFLTSNWSFDSPAQRGVRLHDAVTLQVLSTIDMYPFSWGGNYAFTEGHLSLSPNGHWLAATTATGIRLYNISQEVSGTNIPGCASQPTSQEPVPRFHWQSPVDFDSRGNPIELK